MTSGSVWCDESDGNFVDLVILHINDTHGILLPYDKDGRNIGGISRLATLVKEIQNINKRRMLLLHAGDVFSAGHPLTFHYGGEVNMMAMQTLCYDALTPGNGEFYFGVKNLKRQAAFVNFPVLLANVVYKDSRERLFKPFVIKEIAGVKIAILGLGFLRVSSDWYLECQEPIAVARRFIPKLRDEADLVIALTHIGLDADKKLAAEVPEIDIIIGGHSHIQLDKPIRVPRFNGCGEVIIVQAGENYQFLGQLKVRLELNKSGKYCLSGVNGKLLPIDDKIKKEPKIKELLNRYSEPLSQAVCISEVALENPKTGDNPMGNLVAEAMRVMTESDLALLDRSSVMKGLASGVVTVADIQQTLPWFYQVMKLTLTGVQIQRILSENDALTSGCSCVKSGNVINDLNIGLFPVDLNRSYKVALGEFLLAKCSFLKGAVSNEMNEERVYSLLLEYLLRIGTIKRRTNKC